MLILVLNKTQQNNNQKQNYYAKKIFAHQWNLFTFGFL